MIYQLSHSIISALGFSSEENYAAIKNATSGLKHYTHCFGLPEGFVASMLDDARLQREFAAINPTETRYTKFEMAAILSAFKAITAANLPAQSPEVVFILSTTKGNIELLENGGDFEPDRVHLWRSAQLISQFFGNPNAPIVVSNACISGAAAQITALQLLETNRYREAVVVGADVLSKFVVSGFQSFKALSPTFCQPFDKQRCGLNLGEAAATIIYSNRPPALTDELVALQAGQIVNDATHISAPSRVASGLTQAIRKVVDETVVADLAFINAHGTATPYNDDMESVAITACGLQDVPVNSLKGYLGHTLGAAGIVETIISTLAIKDHTILKTNGLVERGTVNPIHTTLQPQVTEKRHFLKLLSGFGGTNAALLFSYQSRWKIAAYCKIDDEKVVVNGNQLEISKKTDKSSNLMLDIYHSLAVDYPKFFKMDKLSKAGFLAAECIFRTQNLSPTQPQTDLALVLANRSGSLANDKRYQATIQQPEQFYPSPAVFVYTLPNIVAGEIAIRHKIAGPTAFFVMEKFDLQQLFLLAQDVFHHDTIQRVLTGWVEYEQDKCSVMLALLQRNSKLEFNFNELNIN